MRRLAVFLTTIVCGFAAISAVTLGLKAAGVQAGVQRHDAPIVIAGQPNVKGKGGHVEYVADAQTVSANQPATLLLHFRIDPGFHINSHTPKSEMLIPTKILIEDLNGAAVSDVSFPAGTPYSFAFEPRQKLDVYTGEVTLTAHLKAKPGSYTLRGGLHYQACDQAACYPPKTLPLEQPFTAR